MDHIIELITMHQGFVVKEDDARALLARSKAAGSVSIGDDVAITFRKAAASRGGETIALITVGEGEDITLHAAFPDAGAASRFLDDVAPDEAAVSMLPAAWSEIRYRGEPLFVRMAF
jgi:hypothetical protein